MYSRVSVLIVLLIFATPVQSARVKGESKMQRDNHLKIGLEKKMRVAVHNTNMTIPQAVPLSGDLDSNPDTSLIYTAKLINMLHPHKDGELNFRHALTRFRKMNAIFAGGDEGSVSVDSWKYAWMHLPSNIMSHLRLHIKFHMSGDDYTPPEGTQSINVMAGWASEGGVYMEDVEDYDYKVMHVICRDMHTDVDEFLSNLFVHVMFTKQHHHENIVVCKDQQDEVQSCSGRGKCSLALESEYDPDNSQACLVKSVVKARHYHMKLSFHGIAQRDAPLENAWTDWAKNIKDAAKNLTGCAEDDLKVHVVQGATGAFWLMTSEYAMRDLDDSGLKGRYGGVYTDQDRKYASHQRIFSHNSTAMNALNDLNKGKHVYLTAVNQQSVNVELIDMKSWSLGEVDPVLSEELLKATESARQCAVLANVGYAFGSSAYFMGQGLKLGLGPSLASFYVVGKAGGLKGNVGDYMIATSLPQWDNVLDGDSLAMRDENRISMADDIYDTLDELKSGINASINQGPVLSFPAVALEGNSYFERAVEKGAIGVEMEGAYFREALPDVPGLYLYYISDLPHAEGSSLAHESFPWEEGQVLFNGLVRTTLVHMLEAMKKEQPPVSSMIEEGDANEPLSN